MKKNLTKRAIENLRPKEKGEFTVWDSKLPGFGIRVRASGRKSFVLYYRNSHNRLRKITLGEYGVLSPVTARKNGMKLKGKVLEGEDPAGDKRPGMLFSDLVDNYKKHHAPKKKTGKEDIRILKKDFLPNLSHIPVKDITRRDIISILEDIAERGPIMSNRSLACVRKVFNFGVERGYLEMEDNPCVFIKPLGKEKRRKRVLSDREIKTVWETLDELEDVEIFIKTALKLILATALRPGEICNLKWEYINFDSGWIEIPAEETKTGEPHRVPISPMVEQIIEELPRVGSDYLLPGSRGNDFYKDRGIQVNSVSAAVRRNQEAFQKKGIKKWRPHDLRRSATVIIARLGFPRFVIKRVLGHADRDVTAIYDRYSYEREIRQALNGLSDHLEYVLFGKEKKVVDIGRAVDRK